MVKQFKTISTRVKTEDAQKFENYCYEKGCSPFTDLKKYIDGIINGRTTTEKTIGSNNGTPEQTGPDDSGASEADSEVFNDLDYS